MTPELALVIFVVLLWGPTTIWLAYRSVRGGERDTSLGSTGGFAPSDQTLRRPGVLELASLVTEEAFWVCAGCKSINRPAAKRCYGCRLAREAAPPVPHEPASAPGMVPVMTYPASGAPVAPREAGWKPRSDILLAPLQAVAPSPAPGSMATGVRHEPAPTLLPDVPVAVIAASRSPRVAGAAAEPRAVEPKAAAPKAAAANAVATLPRVEAGASPVPPAAVGPLAVCPHLRIEHDSSTWFAFPHPANRCHSEVGAADDGNHLLRLLRKRGAGRPQVISPDVQHALCLTTSFRECARYRDPAAPGATTGEEERPAIVPALPAATLAQEPQAEAIARPKRESPAGRRRAAGTVPGPAAAKARSRAVRGADPVTGSQPDVPSEPAAPASPASSPATPRKTRRRSGDASGQ